MAKRLFNKPVKQCCCCLHGTVSAEGDSVLCEKRGVMSLFGSCRKFVYDPLAREPHVPEVLPEYSDEDFAL
ncbi:MAG: hypothetical protein IJY56_01895 [Clostridia bacterium]|nr:hypothetical protein [Clostridia bacterium]